MVASQPFLRFRGLAVLLLFVAALLVSSVDAVACEPEIEKSQVSFVMASDADHAPTKEHSQRGDACVHGHCHAGSQALTSNDPITSAEPARSTYNPAEPTALGVRISHTPERPPRA